MDPNIKYVSQEEAKEGLQVLNGSWVQVRFENKPEPGTCVSRYIIDDGRHQINGSIFRGDGCYMAAFKLFEHTENGDVVRSRSACTDCETIESARDEMLPWLQKSLECLRPTSS